MAFEWVTEKGRCMESELPEILRKKAGTVLAYYTNTVRCIMDAAALSDIPHLLEVRVFDDSGELRAVRMAMGEPFLWRLADDVSFQDCLDGSSFELRFENRVLLETQYLDIDLDKTEAEGGNGVFFTIGGGCFQLPQCYAGASRVLVQTYLNFSPETGMARQDDWRIVKFISGEDGV